MRENSINAEKFIAYFNRRNELECTCEGKEYSAVRREENTHIIIAEGNKEDAERQNWRRLAQQKRRNLGTATSKIIGWHNASWFNTNSAYCIAGYTHKDLIWANIVNFISGIVNNIEFSGIFYCDWVSGTIIGRMFGNDYCQ